MAWAHHVKGDGLTQGQRLGRTLVQILFLLFTSPALAQVQACPPEGDCVTLSAVGPAAPVVRGDSFALSLQLQPGAEDGAAGGLDDLWAVTFSLSIPGLELADCSNPTAKGITPAIEVLVAPPLTAFVENTSCDDNPARPCLCPGAGQTRASYVNLAVFLPAAEDPESAPTLPAGDLVRLHLRARPEAATEVTVHILNQTDAPGSKPAFGALASIGDALSKDVSVAEGVSRVRVVDAQVSVLEPPTATATLPPTSTQTPLPSSTPEPTDTPSTTATATIDPTPTLTGQPTSTAVATATATTTPSTTATSPAPSATPTVATRTATPILTPTVPICVGDCNHDGKVSVEERRTGVRIALGELPLSQCDAYDVRVDHAVTVTELVASVRDALGACAP